MDRKIVGVLGAVTALVAPQAVQATAIPAPSVTEVLSVQSYADLLDPVPNARALLRATDAAAASQPAGVKKVQYYDYHHHHHHHHIITITRPIMRTRRFQGPKPEADAASLAWWEGGLPITLPGGKGIPTDHFARSPRADIEA